MYADRAGERERESDRERERERERERKREREGGDAPGNRACIHSHFLFNVALLHVGVELV